MVTNVEDNTKTIKLEDFFNPNDTIDSELLPLQQKFSAQNVEGALQLKLKAVDLLILVLENNKNLSLSADLVQVGLLTKILSDAKGSKQLYESAVKKVKTLLSLYIKNCALNKEKEAELAEFIVGFLKFCFNQR